MWNFSEVTLLLYGISFVTVTPVLLYFIAFKGSTVEKILQSFVLFILLGAVCGVVFEPFITDPFNNNPYGVYEDPIWCEYGYYEENGVCVEYVVEQINADGTANNPYVLNNEYDFELMRQYPDRYFVLHRHIELSEHFTPIPEFRGVLIGNGYTITAENLSHMYVSYERGYVGLISVNKGEIIDLDINITLYVEDTEEVNELYVGSVVAYNNGTVLGVNGITNIIVHSTKLTYIGGVIGYTDCVSDADIAGFETENHIVATSEADLYVGGAIGYTRNNVTDLYSTSYIETVTDTVSYTGGNIGYSEKLVMSIVSFGTVQANGNHIYVGGNIGKMGAKVAYDVTELTNNANVYGEGISSAYVGGNIGYSYFARLSSLKNYGDVTGFLSDGYIGGNVGYVDFELLVTSNFGEVFVFIQDTENEDALVNSGGVVGYAEMMNNTHFGGQINLYNYEDKDFNLGGLAGRSLEISNSYVNGTITVQQSGTNSNIGGVAGINNTFMANVIYSGRFVGWEMEYTDISKLAASFNEIENVYIVDDTIHVCDDVSIDELITDQEVVTYIELNDIFTQEFKTELGWDPDVWDLYDYVLN